MQAIFVVPMSRPTITGFSFCIISILKFLFYLFKINLFRRDRLIF